MSFWKNWISFRLKYSPASIPFPTHCVWNTDEMVKSNKDKKKAPDDRGSMDQRKTLSKTPNHCNNKRKSAMSIDRSSKTHVSSKRLILHNCFLAATMAICRFEHFTNGTLFTLKRLCKNDSNIVLVPIFDLSFYTLIL